MAPPTRGGDCRRGSRTRAVGLEASATGADRARRPAGSVVVRAAAALPPPPPGGARASSASMPPTAPPRAACVGEGPAARPGRRPRASARAAAAVGNVDAAAVAEEDGHATASGRRWSPKRSARRSLAPSARGALRPPLLATGTGLTGTPARERRQGTAVAAGGRPEALMQHAVELIASIRAALDRARAEAGCSPLPLRAW